MRLYCTYIHTLKHTYADNFNTISNSMFLSLTQTCSGQSEPGGKSKERKQNISRLPIHGPQETQQIETMTLSDISYIHGSFPYHIIILYFFFVLLLIHTACMVYMCTVLYTPTYAITLKLRWRGGQVTRF